MKNNIVIRGQKFLEDNAEILEYHKLRKSSGRNKKMNKKILDSKFESKEKL